MALFTDASSEEWGDPPGVTGNKVLRASDASTINRLALTARDRTLALSIVSRRALDAELDVVSLRRNRSGNAWILLVKA